MTQSDGKVCPEEPIDINIWQDYLPDPISWANSLLVHVIAVTALVLPFALRQMLDPVPVPKMRFGVTPLFISLPQLHGHADKSGGGGGGGVSDPFPASKGALPPFADTQFTPPMVKVPDMPLLPMPPTLLGAPEVKLPAMNLDLPWGDPNGVNGPQSGGPGTGGGIGNGIGPGVGPGKGPGYGPGQDGNWGGGPFIVGGGVSAPVPIYKPEPAYSEEARKAKFGGIVLLWIVVDAQGNVRDVQVAKRLGMGLDEEAVKAVQTWKFKPGLRQQMPVPVRVMVEVSFRLF